jgi:uncharacterized protein YjbJ (UPF0337 family)
LIVELSGDQTHRLWAVPTESLPPHLQLECCVMRVLSGKIRDGRGLARTTYVMACGARGDVLRWTVGQTQGRRLNAINGKREQLEGKLQERYGIAKDQARKEVDDWFRAQTW